MQLKMCLSFANGTINIQYLHFASLVLEKQNFFAHGAHALAFIQPTKHRMHLASLAKWLAHMQGTKCPLDISIRL